MIAPWDPRPCCPRLREGLSPLDSASTQLSWEDLLDLGVSVCPEAPPPGGGGCV